MFVARNFFRPWRDLGKCPMVYPAINGWAIFKGRLEVPPQMNPFAKAPREGKAEQQPEML